MPGLNGTCHTSSGAVDEPTIALGGCGSSVAFALTADVPLGEVPIGALPGGAINWIQLVQQSGPLIRRFSSTLRGDLQFPRAATQLAADGGWNLSDTTNFVVADLPFSQLPLSFAFVVRSPDLPSYRGSFAQIVLLRGVANLPGRGLVELGLGSAVNSAPLDARTDLQSGLAQPGLIAIRMAPGHHGLEGAEYAIVAWASTATDLGNPFEGSAVVARLPQNQLKFDPAGAAPVVFPTGYLGFPDSARYNFTDAAQGALAPRTLRFAIAPSLPGATVLRTTFADRLGRRWVVLSDPAQASTGFSLPKPTGTNPDRTFWTGVPTGTRSSLRVEAVALTDLAPIAFQRWVELGSGNPARALDFTTAWSFVDSQRPSVTWLTPATSGAVIAKGSQVVVKVAGFRVGQTVGEDGFVRVSFLGGSGCPAADGMAELSGKGEISITVPATCTGTNLLMIAQLRDRATSAALDPAVDDTLVVTIQ